MTGNRHEYEFVIVGSGAGGATLARELGKRRRDVLVVERGKPESSIGTFQDSLRYFDHTIARIPAKSKEGVILWRSLMAGGSTVVSCGNGVRCLEKELSGRGIELGPELDETEREMKIAPIDERLLSDGSLSIWRAADDLGYQMQPMPKFIDPEKCGKCGQCTMGCTRGGKWTALTYLEEAEESGVRTTYGAKVDRVLVEHGRAVGVSAIGADGAREIRAGTVILAAGGLATPVILQRSGIDEAGSGLFIDLLVNTYGITNGLNQIHEPTMTLVDLEFHQSRGFLLSPFVNQPRALRAIEVGPGALGVSAKNLIGIMTKTRDEPAGRVFADGSVSKPVTDSDWGRLREGAAVATGILIKAGADPKSIVTSCPQGAHPGGTAAIGTVVNSDLRTRVDNLYVCDASVLPEAPGLPPIVTIAALAKRLARTLAGPAQAA